MRTHQSEYDPATPKWLRRMMEREERDAADTRQRPQEPPDLRHVQTPAPPSNRVAYPAKPREVMP